MLLTVDERTLFLKMAAKEMKQSDLVAKAGISQAVIDRIQKGKPIKPVTFGKIARVLDCDPSEIATPISPLREAARTIQGKPRRQHQRSPLQAAADLLRD